MNKEIIFTTDEDNSYVMTSDFIGGGAFGAVYIGYQIEINDRTKTYKRIDDKKYAIKSILIKKPDDYDSLSKRKQEVVLTNLRDSIDQPFFSKQDLIRQGFNEKLLNAQSSAHGSVPLEQTDALNQILVNKYGYGLDKACFEFCIDKILKNN
jgi:hypothetical protein